MKDKGRRTDVATKFEKLYYDTKSPAGFVGIEALSKKIGTPKKTRNYGYKSKTHTHYTSLGGCVFDDVKCWSQVWIICGRVIW